MEEILAKLVAMPTLSDDTKANDIALDYIQEFLAARGMYCTRDRFDRHGTLVASTRPHNTKTPTVLFAGHVDVMTGSEKMFRLRREGDKLIGRGVYDMKFAIAGYMQLVDELRGHLSDYDFAIMVTTDEEYGGRDNINGTKRLIEAGHRPAACILPDSTAPGWEIEKIAKGYWRFDLIASGKTAHGSRPWEGDSASFKLIQALNAIKDIFKDQAPHTDTLNIAVLEGGETYNIIPASMKASLEIRAMGDESYKIIRKKVAAICKPLGIAIQDKAIGAVTQTDLNDPFVQTYMDSVKRITGKRPQGYVSFAASDALYFAENGIPCIVSCPQGGAHHSEQEWISRASVLQFVPILKDYLEKIAKIPAKTEAPALAPAKSLVA